MALAIRYLTSLTIHVNRGLTIFRRTGLLFALLALVLLAGAAQPGSPLPDGNAERQSASKASAPHISVAPGAASGIPAALPRPQPPTIAQALQSGVLIVISKASQRMQVFKDGTPWLSSPVSTGRRGHTTPAGVFAILEKQKFHRSNIYSNAPMPFMQRLTSGGIAIHAGYVPGHPASHGCIRVPYAFARTLFGLTVASQTTVVIVDQAMQSDDQARRLALAVAQPQPTQPKPTQPQPTQPVPTGLAYAVTHLPDDTSPAPPATPRAPVQPRPVAQSGPGAGQTIQLAAALSSEEAEARWNRLLSLHAELGRLDKVVVPVAVGSRRFFRLRASGPGAFSTCSQLKSTGLDCFRVL